MPLPYTAGEGLGEGWECSPFGLSLFSQAGMHCAGDMHASLPAGNRRQEEVHALCLPVMETLQDRQDMEPGYPGSILSRGHGQGVVNCIQVLNIGEARNDAEEGSRRSFPRNLLWLRRLFRPHPRSRRRLPGCHPLQHQWPRQDQRPVRLHREYSALSWSSRHNQPE